jgi:hypothetical protein
MAALTVTATNVTHVSGSVTQEVIGETVTAGQAVYRKAADSRMWLAQADGTAAEAAVVGIVLNGGAAGQPCLLAGNGAVINIGATTEKVHYFANDTAGGVGLQGDVGASDYITRIGYSLTTDGVFYIDIRVTGIEF